MAKSKKSDLEKPSKDKGLKGLKDSAKSSKEGKPSKEKKSAKKEKVIEAKAPKKAPAVKVEAKAEKPKKIAPPIAISFTTEELSLRAYFIAERRQAMGWPGDSTSDWVEAERQLKAEATRQAKA